MSSITFRDATGSAQVSGAERAMCGKRITQLFEGMVDLPGMLRWGGDKAGILRALGQQDERFAWLTLKAQDETNTIAGRPWTMLELHGNTAQACGSDAMRLVARIHCQCEIHGWVDGPDRAWLAGLVEEALAVGLLRREPMGYGRGWLDVVDLLRARDDDMVVMSYSVCDGFPTPRAIEPRPDDEDWEEMSEDERWAQASAALRARDGLRMQPSNWSSFRYGNGEDAFALVKAIEAFGTVALYAPEAGR